MVEHFPPLGFGSFATSTQLMRDSALLRATTELFLQEEAHSPDEMHRYEELTAHLVPKVADQDRALLAERLAGRADAPPAIVRMLAKDRIAIAGPVLRTSPVLGSIDLLSIIATTGVEHHRIIAERAGLTPEVRQALRISADRTLAATLDEIEAWNRMPAATTAKPGQGGFTSRTAPGRFDAMAEVRQVLRTSTEPTPSATGNELDASTVAPSAIATTPGSNAAPQMDANRPAEPHPPPAAQPWSTTREPSAIRGTSRLDPFDFIELDRAARLRLIAEFATRPPIRHCGGPSGRIDRAFRAILGAAQIVGFARRGEQQALVDAIAGSLELDVEFVRTCLDDATGEPFAVLLKSLGLENVQAQQVFLLAMPRIGRDVTAFFRLCDLYAGMEPSVAEVLTDAWREGRTSKPPRHVPHLAENSSRARLAGAEAIRKPAPAAVERKALGSGETT